MKSFKYLSVFVLISLELSFRAPLSFAQDDTLVFVEQMPVFPGGEEAMMKYLTDNIRYPEMARESGISGTVYISFIIEKDGDITNVSILRDIGGGCGTEAARVVRNMPHWEPGYQKGTAVRVQLSLPIKFTLDNGKKKTKKRR